MAKVRQAHPKHDGSSRDPVMLLASLLERHISNEEWNPYNQELENFYLNYEMFVQRLNIWGQIKDRTVTFNLWLDNFGNAPAEDVDVFLKLPPSLKCVAEAESDSAKPLLRPEPPEPPERPVPRFSLPNYNFAASLPLTSIPTPMAVADRGLDDVEVSNEGERGFCIHGKVRRLKHGEHYLVGSFLGVFASWNEVKPFEAEFTISASELPEWPTGKIPFVVQYKEADR